MGTGMTLPKPDKRKLELDHKFTAVDRRIDAIHTYELNGERVVFKENSKRVYVYLYRQFHGGSLSYAYPSLLFLEEVLAIPKSTLKRCLQSLVDCGLVIKETVKRKNRYWVHDISILKDPLTYQKRNPFSEDFCNDMKLKIGKCEVSQAQDDADLNCYDGEVPF